MALRRDQTSGADDAPEAARRPRRLLQRASFVIVLMGLGAIVAALISAAMTVRYDASATVVLPDRLDANALLGAASQTSFAGSDGQSLEVTDDIGGIRFVGSSDDAEVAARTANAAATAFVASVDEDGVRLSAAASAPSSPASPRRLLNLAIGIGIGALLGLILQAALRPPRVDESVTYVPTWTTLEDIPEPDETKAVDQVEAALAAPVRAAAAAPTSRPRPRAFQEAATATASEPIWADDPASDEPAPQTTITIPGADLASPEGPAEPEPEATEPDEPEPDDEPEADAPDADEPEADEPEPDPADEPDVDMHTHDDRSDTAVLDEPTTDGPESDAPVTDEPDDDFFDEVFFDDDTAAAEDPQLEEAPMTDEDPAPTDGAEESTDEKAVEAVAPLPELDIPDPPLSVSRGFRDLVDRTGANLDPMIDRFAADDEAFDEDLESVSPVSRRTNTSASEDDQLVSQIAFLGDEIATYQLRMDEERTRHREERDELIADHEVELEGLRSELELARAEVERVRERRDSARSQLEDRVTELETALAASADELERAQRTSDAIENRRTAANEDLVTEIEFLRIEIERYQRTLDEERVTHSTAVAGARLENQDELDRIHREHRVTLNQLAQTNRNLLTAQRNEAEAVMAELESDHQRALDDAHKDYEQRLAEARAHHADQLASLEERTLSEFQAEQSAELDDLHERLDAALLDTRTAQQRMAKLEAEIASSDRRVEQAQLAHSQTERRLREEHRQMERRNNELGELLTRTEQRLADERRRTNEVVRNLLRESATAASDADWARRSDIEYRDEVEAEQAKEIEQLNERLRSLEATAARRETTLEATIAELRRRLGASPNG